MLKKIRDFFGLIFVYIGVKAMSIFYKKEIKAFEEQLKTIKDNNLKKITEAAVKEAAAMPFNEKALLDEQARLQNEIFKTYILFLKKIQESNGSEMDGIGGIWQVTTVALNRTLTLAFGHKDDEKIKNHLYIIEKELQLAIDTNQEILGTKGTGGGFGYSGPMGQA